MKLSHIVVFVSLVFVAYIGGFVTGIKKIFPYTLTHQMYRSFLPLEHGDILGFNTCEIEEVFELPSVFSVLIGHAYGDTTKNNGFIAPKIERFLQKNNLKIQNIIFTGDVFNVPSQSKWNSLFEKFGLAKIYIAPGNHDITIPGSKEIFQKNKFIRKDFPYDLPIHDNLSLVIDDSIYSNERVGKDLKSFIKNIATERIFVARHNMPISQLIQYANNSNTNSFGLIPSVSNFIEDFSKTQNFTWIMGDSGSTELPWITCHSFKNHRFIVNGIGEIKGDVVLLIINGKIHQYVLN